MLLKNQTCLVTGASRGIGKSICSIFAENGARLILTGRDLDDLRNVSEELPNGHLKHLYFQMNVQNTQQIEHVFKELKKSNIHINTLVNNAGIMQDATLQMVKPQTIENIYSTNVYGTIYPSQQAIKPLIRNKGGSIINLTSIIGTNGNKGQTVYGSSKSAIIGFTKSLSKELAPLNIRVNAIAPGFIDTDMTKGMGENFYKKNISSIGMQRIGKPEDVARLALFLASDLSSYITGQIIGVDGGMII